MAKNCERNVGNQKLMSKKSFSTLKTHKTIKKKFCSIIRKNLKIFFSLYVKLLNIFIKMFFKGILFAQDKQSFFKNLGIKTNKYFVK